MGTVNQITAGAAGSGEDVARMPTMRPRPSRRAPARALPSSRPAAPPRAATGPAQALRILVAGVDKDERGAVEDAVRQGLGSRAASGPWSVSVVHMAGKWSVTVDGGGLRSASVMTEAVALAQAIRGLVDGAVAVSAPAATPPASPAEVRDRHACERCGQAMLVVYESQPDEPKELAPVACPHCWAIGHVEIGASAAAGHEYRSEKA